MGVHEFEKTYDSALEKLERRPKKGGPTSSAAFLEKDGPRRGMEETDSNIETGKIFVRSVFRKPIGFTTIRTENAPMRTLATGGGGMWRSRGTPRESRSSERPAKRRDFGRQLAP
ncbi:hypothetical protein Aduo_019004 [Ancylostoma duodenale]